MLIFSLPFLPFPPSAYLPFLFYPAILPARAGPLASLDSLKPIRHPAEIPVLERKYGQTLFHLQPPRTPGDRPGSAGRRALPHPGRAIRPFAPPPSAATASIWPAPWTPSAAARTSPTRPPCWKNWPFSIPAWTASSIPPPITTPSTLPWAASGSPSVSSPSWSASATARLSGPNVLVHLYSRGSQAPMRALSSLSLTLKRSNSVGFPMG